MNQDWSIQSRSEQCSASGTPFVAGEVFHTLLFNENAALRREDLCEAAFKARPADAPAPFSQWRAKFEPNPAKPPEALGKQTAEQLLRHYMGDPDPKWRNVRYILAVMLERKRILKEMETVRGEDGALSRVYQFPKTGEVLVVPDPQLRLDQIAQVQEEVASLLGGAPPAQPPAPPEEGGESSTQEPAAPQEPQAPEEPTNQGLETAGPVSVPETTAEAAPPSAESDAPGEAHSNGMQPRESGEQVETTAASAEADPDAANL